MEKLERKTDCETPNPGKQIKSCRRGAEGGWGDWMMGTEEGT